MKEPFGIESRRRGRRPKPEEERHEAVSIRLHPQVLRWARVEAERRGIGYQTVINEALLKISGGAD